MLVLALSFGACGALVTLVRTVSERRVVSFSADRMRVMVCTASACLRFWSVVLSRRFLLFWVARLFHWLFSFSVFLAFGLCLLCFALGCGLAYWCWGGLFLPVSGLSGLLGGCTLLARVSLAPTLRPPLCLLCLRARWRRPFPPAFLLGWVVALSAAWLGASLRPCLVFFFPSALLLAVLPFDLPAPLGRRLALFVLVSRLGRIWPAVLLCIVGVVLRFGLVFLAVPAVLQCRLPLILVALPVFRRGV